MNGRNIDSVRPSPLNLVRNKTNQGNLVPCTCFLLKRHTHRSITGTVWEAIGDIPFEAAPVIELEFSPTISFGEMECNSNVVRWTMWRKKVIGTRVMPLREMVLRVDESVIFKSASFSSLLKLFQFQGFETTRLTIIEKRSRQQKGSRRIASSDVPLIHSENSEPKLNICSRVMVLTKDWMTGFWTRNWWIPWQVWSLLR